MSISDILDPSDIGRRFCPPSEAAMEAFIQQALEAGVTIEATCSDGEYFLLKPRDRPSAPIKLVVEATDLGDGIYEGITMRFEQLPDEDLDRLARAQQKRQRRAQRRISA